MNIVHNVVQIVVLCYW